MKKNKLSREELIKYLDYFYSHSPVIDDPEANAKQAYEQIKSTLIPIPKDKPDEFLRTWVHKFEFTYEYHTTKEKFVYMLEAYDELKEGK